MATPDIEDIYEVSPIQHGLLFHSLYVPGSGVYVEQISCSLQGRLDEQALIRAWREVFERHPALRTSFHWREIDRPLQVVHRGVDLPYESLDWSFLDAAERAARWHSFLDDDRALGFELTTPPLVRLSLIRWAKSEWKMAWRFSHTIQDGWGVGIALREWLVLYKADVAGRRVHLPPAPGYREYVGWWKAQEQSASKQRAKAFWERCLSGFQPPESLDLGPGEVLPEGAPTHEWEEIQLGALATRLVPFLRAERLTANTVIQAAWHLLLSRYTGQQDLVVGNAVAHRPADLPGAEEIVGPMLITLPARTQLIETQPVREWLQQFQREQAEAREHLTSSLVEIQQWAGISGRSRLFETCVVFENIPLPNVVLADEGLEVSDVRYDGRPHYALTLVTHNGSDFPLRLIYDRRRFRGDVARRILVHLLEVITSMVDDVSQPVAAVNLLSAEEQRSVMRDWQSVEPQETFLLHDAFRQQATSTPDAIALVDEDETTTYAELDLQSDRLAAQLSRRGVTRGDVVAIVLGRSARAIVAVLGILKAGAAYVAVDPINPPERIELVLEDCRPKAVVADETTRGLLSVEYRDSVLSLDRDFAEGPLSPEPAPDAAAAALDDLAYVMFTSGSTGRPKGTLVSHRNVSRLLSSGRKRLAVGANDVWTLFYSTGFDLSVSEMWGALLTGARLIIVPSEALTTPGSLLSLLTRHKVTVLSITPSAFAQLLPVPNWPDEQPLRYIVFGGERLDTPGLAEWVDRFGLERPALVNMYGPTETTIYAMFHRLTEADVKPEACNIIGRPLPDTRAYILDASLRPLPVAVTGELVLGGAGVAQGYLGRPELTAERFLADPYVEDATARLYRTGDLARFRDDGSIEFLGRRDDQVKVRGYRVELGEIATLLRSHPEISDAAVTLTSQGDEQLVAYVVGAAGLSDAEAARWLSNKLPPYMVPSAWMRLDALPLTANGKLDRAALPAHKPSARDTTAARTPTEHRLAAILSETLKTDLGITDDLVMMGMHSLLATRILLHVREVWQIDLPFRVLYERPTVKQLAAFIDAGSAAHKQNTVTVDQLSADVALDQSFIPLQEGTRGAPQRILLTGATGFLGTFLLDDLLKDQRFSVTCLVRASGHSDAFRRLNDSRRDLGLAGPLDVSRVSVVCGDLAAPQLGLSPDEYLRLATRVDAVLHGGAQVDFFASYGQLRCVNVNGTRELLGLAALGQHRSFHFVSTVGVVPLTERRVTVRENDDLGEPPLEQSGYAQSKWVAEKLVRMAADQGIPVSIYRPGRISGDRRTGAWVASDAICRLVAGCIKVGAVPAVDTTFEMVPVDYVSASIVSLLGQRTAPTSVWHLVNPDRISLTVLAEAALAVGYELPFVPYETWTDRARAGARTESDLAIADALFAGWMLRRDQGLQEPDFDDTHVRAALGGRHSPGLSREEIDRYVRSLAARALAGVPSA
jgi:surfactin family lipopeptide synthetase C